MAGLTSAGNTIRLSSDDSEDFRIERKSGKKKIDPIIQANGVRILSN